MGIGLGPSASIDHLGIGVLRLQPGAQLNLWKEWSSLVRSDFRISWVRNQMVGPKYAYLQGYHLDSVVRTQLKLGARHVVFVDLGYGVESNRDYSLPAYLLPLSYMGPSTEVGIQLDFESGWELAGSVGAQWRSYRNLSIPEGIARQDETVYLKSKVSHTLVGALRGFSEATWLKNSSTIGPSTIADRNYSQTQLIAGLTWN
jgi:hypothetical protein